jgi:hypothetical protein
VDVQPPGRPIFLADINPNYYNLNHLEGYQIEPVGPIYRLLTTR